MDTRTVRRFLELRLVDLSNATGISVYRLSLAERGLAPLHPTELVAVESFLRERLDCSLEWPNLGGTLL